MNREGEELLQLLIKSYICYLQSVFTALCEASQREGRLMRSVCLVDAAGVSASTLCASTLDMPA